MGDFVVKDSGERQQFDSGMVRDTTAGKIDYSLMFDGPMFERWADHITKGAVKYTKRNWMQASGDAELQRFRESAIRHFVQWVRGETDEDHAAAVFFNINGAEYVREATAPVVTVSDDPEAGWCPQGGGCFGSIDEYARCHAECTAFHAMKEARPAR